MAGRHPHHPAIDGLGGRLQRLAKLPVALQAQALSSAIILGTREERQVLGAALAQLCLPLHDRTQGHQSSVFWPLKSLSLPRGTHDRSLSALRELALVWAHVPADVRDVARIAGRDRWAQLVPTFVNLDQRALESLALCAAEVQCAAWTCYARLASYGDNASTRRAGERALLSLALWTAGESYPPDGIEGLTPIANDEHNICTPSDMRLVTAEVRAAWEALATHRTRGMVLAILAGCSPRLLRQDRSLVDLFASHDARASVVLGALRSSPWNLARQRAWEWAGFAGVSAPTRLAHACRARLSSCATREEHAEVLRRAHLGLVPTRARVARGVIVRGARRLLRGAHVVRVPVRSALPEPSVTKRLATPARREIPRWASMIRADVPTKVAACEPLLTDPEPSVRMALARWGPGPLLGDLTHDAHAGIATSARVRLLDEATERGVHIAIDRGAACSLLAHRTAQLHARSPHALIRSLTGVAQAEPDALRTGVLGRQRLWTWLRDDRAGLLDYLRNVCTSRDDEDAIAGLLTARRMGLAEQLHDAARTILRSTSATSQTSTRRLATVASFLGACAGPEVRGELMELTRHADPRVRANTIDALLAHARTQPDAHDVAELKAVLAPHAGSDEAHHRVRGSAVRAMLLQEQTSACEAGAEALTRMLLDARPPHRLAGVWVLGRVRSWMDQGDADWLGVRVGARARTVWFPQWRACVHEMATREPDPHLSRRAAACATLLEPHTPPRAEALA